MGLYVYVAGPMSQGNQFVLARQAIDAAQEIMQRGHEPFVPQLSFFWSLVYHNEYERWMTHDFAWIRRCDVLVRIPGASPGANREVAYAQMIGRPVFIGLDEFKKSSYWAMSAYDEIDFVDKIHEREDWHGVRSVYAQTTTD